MKNIIISSMIDLTKEVFTLIKKDYEVFLVSIDFNPDYDNLYKDYDLIITGEGKIDSQSMQGKVISSIIKRTKDRKIILVCAINEIKDSQYEILSIVNDKVTKEMSMSDPETYFRMMIQKI